MYGEYFLTEEKQNVISEWMLKSKEPLFIYGPPGCGKSSLAAEILNKRIITTIDSLFMKNNNDIGEYITNIIQKRNITMMFTKKQESRGLIIDDIDVFYRHDKKIFKSVLNLLLGYNYFDTKIIITCKTKFLTSRAIDKLKYSKILLEMTNDSTHKICNTMCQSININLPLVKRNELIKRSNGDLNNLWSLIKCENIIKIDYLDNFDVDKLLFEKLFTETYDLKKLIRIYENNKIKISLDILENIFNYSLPPDIIEDVYNKYVFVDIFDTECINLQNINEYNTILTIYNFYLLIRKYKISSTNTINNKYISKSLIHTYASKLNYEYSNIYKEIIYFNLKLIHLNHFDKDIYIFISRIDRKELNFYIKSFNYFYNGKIKIDNIYKAITNHGFLS